MLPPRRAVRGCFVGLALLAACALVGCAAQSSRAAATGPGFEVELLSVFTDTTIGAGQGVAVIDGLVYVYGDAATGVIREFRPGIEGGRPTLEPTGRVVRLTRYGEDVVPHPTGLTHHPTFGVFLGDTVRRVGVIHHVDWPLALADGNLDRAIRNSAVDDVAVNGCRPEFVRATVDGVERWLVASADYGDDRNEVRLYDPERLARASRTSAPGVLVARFPSGPFVQTMHWIDADRTLVLVQNSTPGLGWRFTAARFEGGALVAGPPLDLSFPTDELEGFAALSGGFGVFVSAMPVDNVRLGRARALPAR